MEIHLVDMGVACFELGLTISLTLNVSLLTATTNWTRPTLILWIKLISYLDLQTFEHVGISNSYNHTEYRSTYTIFALHMYYLIRGPKAISYNASATRITQLVHIKCFALAYR